MKLKKKLPYLAFVFCFLGLNLYAQKSINTSGGLATGDGGSISYSIGQSNIQTITNDSYTIIEGIQRSYITPYVTGPKTIEAQHLALRAFPNPSTTHLLLENKNKTLEDAYCELYDTQGRMLLKANINSAITTLDVKALPSQMYFLKVVQDNTCIKTFKIIKN